MIHLDEFGGEEYTVEEVTEAAIPAKCTKCGRVFLGRDAIRSPTLRNCHCWRCHAPLVVHPLHRNHVDAETRRRMRECPLFWREGVKAGALDLILGKE